MSLIWRACGRAARSCAAGRHKKGGASIKTQNPLLWNVSNGSQGSSVSLPHSLKHWNYMQTKIFSSHFYRKYFHCFPEFKLELGLQKYFAHMHGTNIFANEVVLFYHHRHTVLSYESGYFYRPAEITRLMDCTICTNPDIDCSKTKIYSQLCIEPK